MCSPTMLFATSLGIKAATSTYSAYQQVQKGKYEKGVADYNARIAENEATRVREIGTEREMEHRRQTSGFIETQKTQAAASGLDIKAGTPLKLQSDAAAMGEADALRIRRGFTERAESIEQGAEFMREQGEYAKKAGRKQAVGTLLGGAANIGTSVLGSGLADKWFTPSSAVTS